MSSSHHHHLKMSSTNGPVISSSFFVREMVQLYVGRASPQVSQLRVENSSLLKRLTDINQKYNESAVDNRVLKADVETLRAKVS